MYSYRQRISVVIGERDPAVLAVVEDLMRDGRSGLDALTPARFDTAARAAYADVAALAASGCLAEYCAGVGLPVPVPPSRSLAVTR